MRFHKSIMYRRVYRLKKEELSKIKSDYKWCVEMNDINNAKSNELTCTLVDLKKKLQVININTKQLVCDEIKYNI